VFLFQGKDDVENMYNKGLISPTIYSQLFGTKALLAAFRTCNVCAYIILQKEIGEKVVRKMLVKIDLTNS